MLSSGYTTIEIIIVLGIMGIMLVTAFPGIMNSMETRNLDNCARSIQSVIEQAKYRAVTDKVIYRVHFVQAGAYWNILLEYQTSATTWAAFTGYHTVAISPGYTSTAMINLPTSTDGGKELQFSPVGLVLGYDSTKNTVTVQSTKLLAKHQPDLRILQIYGGGSIQFLRTSS